jgi:hypothetical protein
VTPSCSRIVTIFFVFGHNAISQLLSIIAPPLKHLHFKKAKRLTEVNLEFFVHAPV